MIRRSLDVRSWEAAQKIVRDLEAEGERGLVRLHYAWERFIDARKAKGSGDEAVKKLERLRDGMEDRFGDCTLLSISVDDLAKFQESWRVAPITGQKQLERLRSFYKFCMSRKWIDENPARALDMPPIKAVAVKPYETSELEKITWALDLFRADFRERLREFVAVLRWTGLRIRYVVQLRRSLVQADFIVLRTHKNLKPVKLLMHPDVKAALEKNKNVGNYFFWSGLGEPKSCVGDWQRSLRRLGELAGVHIHAHRWRHTFATDLLSKGVPVSEVAAILGNTPAIVEKHYSQWIRPE
jgi:site-specific recombinase XerD